nr:DUF6571 family protein [Actinomyces oris]
MVKHIKINKDGVQNLINGLTKFKNQVINSNNDVMGANINNSSFAGEKPVSLSSFTSTVTSKCSDIQKQIDLLQSRLDAAIAANEGGVTTTNPDGTISYQLPDGVEDTAANTEAIKKENKVDLVNQARQDAATLKTYRDRGCGPGEYDELLARLQKNANNPVYANALLANVPPEVLLDVPLVIQNGFPETYEKDMWDNADLNKPLKPSVRPHAARDLSTALGNILASASGSDNWSAEKGKAYGDTLADLCQEQGKGDRTFVLNQMLSVSESKDIDGDGVNETVGRDFNDTMLSTLATRLEDFTPQVGNYDYNSILGKNPSRSYPTRDLETTTLGGVVHAMTGNPDAARSWLTVNNKDGSVNAEETVKRANEMAGKQPIGGNKWTDDWSMLSAQQSIQGVNADDGGAAQAAIVSGALNHIGEAGNDINLTDAARNSVSIALSNYPLGVQMSADQGDMDTRTWSADSKSWAGSMPVQPVFSDQALTNLIGEMSKGGGKDGTPSKPLARYTGAQESFNKLQQENEAKNGNLHHALEKQSETRGFTAGAIARQAEIDGGDADAEVGRWAEMYSNAINNIPLPDMPGFSNNASSGTKMGANAMKAGVDFSASMLKNAAANQFKTSYTEKYGGNLAKAQRSGADIKSAGVNETVEYTTATLIKNGYYTPEQIRAAAKSSGAKLDGILDDNGKPIVGDPWSMTPEQRTSLTLLSEDLPMETSAGNVDIKEVKTGYNEAYGASHDQPK